MAERFSTGFRNEVCGPSGSSMADALQYSVMRIYTGTQPTTADAAETGTLLLEVTKGSAASTDPMTSGNGLTFEAAVAGVAPKTTAETWSGEAVASGTAGWYRIYDLDYDLGSSSTAIRVDGSISTAEGADLQMANTAITSGGTTTINSASMTFPAS